MPKFEELIGSFMQDRDSGEPTKPEVPGASPGVSRPGGPNPPSLNSSRPGRPPNPPMVGGSGGQGGQSRDPETMEQQKQADGAIKRMMLSKIPTASEWLDYPDDEYDTPYGVLTRDGKIAFTPEGEQKYNEQKVHARKGFGPHPFNGMPDAPEFDVELGKSFFNPFAGKFGRF